MKGEASCQQVGPVLPLAVETLLEQDWDSPLCSSVLGGVESLKPVQRDPPESLGGAVCLPSGCHPITASRLS